MFTLLSLIAQASQPSPTTQQPPAFLQSPLVPLLLGVAVLYFFVFRAKRNQERQRQETLEKLRPGQRIQTIGGILGVIHSSTDKEVTIKVDETNNVKIKFVRGAIHRVFDEDKDKPEQKS